MKIKQTRNFSKRNKLLFAVVSIIVTLALCILYFFIAKATLFGWSPLSVKETATSGLNKPSNDQIKNGQEVKNDSLVNNKGTSGSDKPVSPVPAVGEGRTTEVDITSISPIESIVRVSVMISYLDQSGVCDISITNDKDTSIYTASVGTQAQSNTSVCKGFDVPASVFTPGKYKVFISYRSGDVSGSAEQNYVSN